MLKKSPKRHTGYETRVATSIEAIKQAPAPSSELRSLLGLAGFYFKFVPHFSDVVEPLRTLLRGNKPFAWILAAEDSITNLKPRLTTCNVPHFFELSLSVIIRLMLLGTEFVLYCSATTRDPYRWLPLPPTPWVHKNGNTLQANAKP